MSPAHADGLNVIALVSGGKDSFFSLLHCRANGHRIVALANLHPAPPPPPPQKHGSPPNVTPDPPAATVSAAPAASAATPSRALDESTLGARKTGGPPWGSAQDGAPTAILPNDRGGEAGNEALPAADEDEHDLNSFMYQTVGHEVIPLYAEATGIPLYRQAIAGGASQHGKDYFRHPHSTTAAPGAGPGCGGPLSGRHSEAGGEDAGRREPGVPDGSAPGAGAGLSEPDETESMIPLLQAVKKAHPEANAVCAGAILSTYQRTRVESVATRLGLTPLAYLWKFPALPVPGSPPVGFVADSDAQLLDDMAAVGIEARIIKVASGGLDDSFLWANAASAAGKSRLARAMRRFGAAETGAVIGEGGEFETLVLDGPPALFKKRIVVPEENMRVVREGGGSAWLSLRGFALEDKAGEVAGESAAGRVRIPDLLDPKFATVLQAITLPGSLPGSGEAGQDAQADFSSVPEPARLGFLQPSKSGRLQQWSFVSRGAASLETETWSIVEQIRERLRQHSLPPSAMLAATVVLRRMADFPAVNAIYGTLFDAPNPPSRVTVAAGDALSAAAAADCNIAIHVTVHTALPPAQRHGLHVQSRSYWAPANIGPYSQAIAVPLASLGPQDKTNTAGGPRLVGVAGQIPLVPARMTMPSLGEGERALRMQTALALQHLWRIGADVGVRWWTSAVAYFSATMTTTTTTTITTTTTTTAAVPANGGETDMAWKVKAAALAWRAAHASRSSSGRWDGDEDEDAEEDNDDDDDDESGPDLWDRRFNPLYRSYAGGDGGEKAVPPALPDRSVLCETDTKALVGSAVRPPVFVAEVEELPRGAGVEWHAHLGIAEAGEGSVGLRRVCWPGPAGGAGDVGGGGAAQEVVLSQVVVRPGESWAVRFVQTVVAEGLGSGRRPGRHDEIAKAALGQLGDVGHAGEPAAAVRYVDVGVLRTRGELAGAEGEGPGPVVPCRSLWDEDGKRLAAVTVYHSVFE